MQAKPSGKQWTNPNVQAWVSTNKAPKSEQQAYARFLAALQFSHVGLKFK